MGFFDNFLPDIANSGTIGGVLDAVGTIASLVPLAEESQGSDQDKLDPALGGLGDIFGLLNTAANVIAALATKRPSTMAWPSSLEDEPTKTADLAGLWTQPSWVRGGYAMPLTMYRDISRFLSEKGFPTHIGDDEDYHDVAEAIGAFAFAENPNPPTKEDLYKFPSFHISDKNNDAVIQGRHIYYAIPDGSAAEDNLWHSHLHLEYRAKKNFLQKQKQLKQSTFSHTDKVGFDAPSWGVTFKILYRSVLIAERAYPIVKDLLEKQHPTWIVYHDQVTGSDQTIKINVPPKTLPATVLDKLTAVVSEAVGKVANSSAVRFGSKNTLADAASGVGNGPDGKPLGEIPQIQYLGAKIIAANTSPDFGSKRPQ
ncbi:hypothetical protein K461DRAFT_321822 [Myriangium duriaei CBS 260.36]|uniref:Uncharacterized protein n=1 Tax=Myriangium duriaei CBS 260.36 TaxID=1168546 RepID=A0A9P4J1A7_9PEZI|nr:hypothetical protein K461DRAFT_321822 [Myriangium duriaei CBS 260.36]